MLRKIIYQRFFILGYSPSFGPKQRHDFAPGPYTNAAARGVKVDEAVGGFKAPSYGQNRKNSQEAQSLNASINSINSRRSNLMSELFGSSSML